MDGFWMRGGWLLAAPAPACLHTVVLLSPWHCPCAFTLFVAPCPHTHTPSLPSVYATPLPSPLYPPLCAHYTLWWWPRWLASFPALPTCVFCCVLTLFVGSYPSTTCLEREAEAHAASLAACSKTLDYMLTPLPTNTREGGGRQSTNGQASAVASDLPLRTAAFAFPFATPLHATTLSFCLYLACLIPSLLPSSLPHLYIYPQD